MATTPPGWYDDGHGGLRWWDGGQWTEQVQTPDPEAPPGDPGAAPAEAAPSGAFIAATERGRSKLWIVWVIVGVVLLGVVLLAAVVLPMLLGLFGNASGGVAPADDDERAAVGAVELYDQGWTELDCDAFQKATTALFLEEGGLIDCEAFTDAAADFSASVQDYTVVVTSIERAGDVITIQTAESYGSLFDEDGAPFDEPVAAEDRYEYTVVASEGGWAIDDLVSR